jgi:hypothetical protein
MDTLYYPPKCQANQYGECTGYNKDVDVIFRFRTKTRFHKPDEVVKVFLCNTHRTWLNKIHQNEPLKMRGEAIEYALYDDLFTPFEKKRTIYTLVKFQSDINDIEIIKYFLINSRDLVNFKTLLIKSIPEEETKKTWISDEGFFQTFCKIIYDDENETKYHVKDDIAEIIEITGELQMEAISEKLLTFYKPVDDGEYINITEHAVAWIERKEKNPTFETEYTIEPIPEFIKTYFSEKQIKEQYEKFEECMSFIEGEIELKIINWVLLRDKSPHTDKGVFNCFQKLTKALIENDEFTDSIITDMNSSGDLTPDVLWITYIMANHELFESHDPKKNLKKNTKLIDLFIEKGIEKELLTLAISGERVRCLTVKCRDHHNILNENQFVVEYLVPKYIQSNTIIYKFNNYDYDYDNVNVNISLTPLDYWHTFNNITTYIGRGLSNPCDNDETFETFEKNENIREYLEKNI